MSTILIIGIVNCVAFMGLDKYIAKFENILKKYYNKNNIIASVRLQITATEAISKPCLKSLVFLPLLNKDIIKDVTVEPIPVPITMKIAVVIGMMLLPEKVAVMKLIAPLDWATAVTNQPMLTAFNGLFCIIVVNIKFKLEAKCKDEFLINSMDTMNR